MAIDGDTRLSIVVVSYNTRDLTLACLRSVYQHAGRADLEVIILDNASSDGSADAIVEQCPQARLVRSTHNLGFAGGTNAGAALARGEWILLLNPDTVVLDHAIDTLVAFAEQHPAHSIFGGRTLFADRRLNPWSCWRRPTPWSAFCVSAGLTSLFPASALFARESLGAWQRDTVREVDIVSGCFLLIRRDLWQELRGFDPAFFMYGEEVDLCLRAAKLGHKCLICPDAQIVHYGGASEKIRCDQMVRLFTAKAQLFRRHWSPRAARFGIRMLDGWALSRTMVFRLASFLGTRYSESYRTWLRVWRERNAWRSPSDTVSMGQMAPCPTDSGSVA